MTEHELTLAAMRMVLVLIAGDCDLEALLPAYHTTLVEAWGTCAPEGLQDFQQLVHEINAAIATKQPAAIQPTRGN